MNMKDYYKILEITPNATNEEIRSQYFLLLHAWHPDKFPTGSLEDKATEKIKDINQAYYILSDPVRRMNYDRNIYYSSNSHQEQNNTNADRVNNHQTKTSSDQFTSEPPKQTGQNNEASQTYCPSCGLKIKTKKVRLMQNIGLLVVRRQKVINENLCRNCINYYYWEFTGKTIMFGWWGVISFIFTPVILISNTFNYLNSLSMEKSLFTRTPKPNSFWIFSTVSGFIIIIYLLLSSLIAPILLHSNITWNTAQTPTIKTPSTPIAVIAQIFTPTINPDPIIVSLSTPTITKSPYSTTTTDCHLWSEINSKMIGEKICVYGTIYKTRFVGDSTFQILFSKNEKAFFLAAGTYYYDVDPGDCVVAKGKILRSSLGVPYIDIDEDLFQCVDWMK